MLREMIDVCVDVAESADCAEERATERFTETRLARFQNGEGAAYPFEIDHPLRADPSRSGKNPWNAWSRRWASIKCWVSSVSEIDIRLLDRTVTIEPMPLRGGTHVDAPESIPTEIDRYLLWRI